MKTSSYFTYHGPGRIGITFGNPRACPPGYRMYRRLAPRREMLKMRYARYRRLFDSILSELDAQAEWDRLHELAAGHEPVLLCFERPPFSPSNWCHRRMVAEWFGSELGHDVPEMGHGMVPVLGRQRSLF